MRTSKVVLVVHPDAKVRVLLRSALQAHGCIVATDHSCADLLFGESTVLPDVILLDRSFVAHEGLDMLSDLNRKWKDAESVFLPDNLLHEDGTSPSLSSVLDIIDRLVKMQSTRDLLAI